MTDSRALPLIVASGVLMALFDVAGLLPGNPDLSSGATGLAGVLAIQALIVWRLLWHRSGFAWAFGLLGSAGYAVTAVLAQVAWETTVVVTCLLALAQAVLLCMPPVLAYVWGRDETVATTY